MSTRSETPLEQMTQLAGEMTEVALASQASALRLLQAEMQALAQMMPGGAAAQHASKPDNEIEADFDNMPV